MATVTSLNAVDYGMVSGTADQTAHFQSAINAAQTQGLPLFIPPGTYPITTVNITAPIEIYSAGAATITGYQRSPIINIAPSGSTAFGPVHIRDLIINGQNQAFPGGLTNPGLISANQVNNLTIERCELLQSGNHGIFVQKSYGLVANNQVTSAANFGIYSLDTTLGVLIKNNQITYSGNNGIYIARSSASGDQSIVSSNEIGFTSSNGGGTGPNGNAVIVYLANFVKVQDNMIYTAAFSGIRLNGSSYGVITGNQCYNCSEMCIRIEAAASNTPYTGGVISNNIINICGAGISVSNSNNSSREVVITGNQIYGCSNNSFTGYKTWGTGIWAEADVIVSNNIIDTSPDWGIVVYPTNNGTVPGKISAQVMGNTIKACAGGVGFYQADTTYGRTFIGGNIVNGFTTTTKYAAIVPITYNGATGEISKVSGATDLGNATSSGFSNVALLLNYSFT